ncbi:MAG TPA: hypothetical protein VGN19_02915 [Pedococcus sp.]|jgi:hypothetical protein|nr:hypothetical protein [Pedococcus sp.]
MAGRLKPYFVETRVTGSDQLAATLWQVSGPWTPEDARTALEQYKLYVEMADRVSARRSLANTFFLTLNTAVFTLIGVLWKDPPRASAWLGLFPTVVLVIQCFVWFWIIRSYRQLSSGKWAVVGALEQRLPAAPSSAEWAALGRGQDPALYWPLTHVEQWVPPLFALAYVAGFVALALA